MASDLDFVEFVVDQIENAGVMAYRKMFGEFALYCEGKVVALICDNQLFVKPTKAGKSFSRLNTKRIVGRLSTPDDENSILTVLEENIHTRILLIQKPDSIKEAHGIANNMDLPPGGKRKFLRNMLLFSKDTHEVVGTLGLYLGYPKEDILYIGKLFLRPNWQGKGYGKEIVSDLEKRAFRNHINEIRIGVGLKNWTALIFWTKLGYDKITKITGDTEFGSDKFAVIELIKKLDHFQ